MTLEIRDGKGGSVSACNDLLTDYIRVSIFDSRTDEVTTCLMDPKDQEAKTWLKSVFTTNPGLDMLLGGNL